MVVASGREDSRSTSFSSLGATMVSRMKERTLALPVPVDIRLTLAPLRHGAGDPTVKLDANEFARATRTVEGPATLHLQISGERCTARAWGPGAEWCLDKLEDLLGFQDDCASFDCTEEFVRYQFRKSPGFRFCSCYSVFELLVPTILEQKVTGIEARRSFQALVQRYGEPAPGPLGLKLQPSPEALAAMPYADFHPLGIERKRALTIKRAAERVGRLEKLREVHGDQAQRLMMTIPGIGPWTSAIVAQSAWGDPDAVIVGDFHFPNMVTWILAREPRGTDERMLELLDPFQGHRGRVVRLMQHSGVRAPMYGPRHRLRDFAAF